jgi:predicted O-linked N-acetylglucosamine transferase (SPINDLY family)
LNDDQAAQLIRADRIDILIDLSGHSARHRLLVLARKPAPVQVTWLGYPNTTGMSAIDYRITDRVSDPVGETESLHSENLIRLSSCWCYQPPLNAPAVAPLPSASGAPVTFGSFNTLAKVSPTTLKLWSQVLAAVPNSRLIIKAAAATEESVQNSIRNQLGAVGDRVVFLAREPDSFRHLQTYAQIDIVLDTHPYNGTTMTCEALWMGVPVIPLAGRSHVSRVGASLLSSVGLPELIAQDPADYVVRARSFAENLPRLHQLRQQMRHRLTDSPLLDQSRFTRELEAAYRQMWQSWCQS